MKTFARKLLYGVLVILYLLHNDWWFWNDSRLVLALPAGLLYHIAYCVAAALMMAALVRHAWPENLDVSEERGRL